MGLLDFFKKGQQSEDTDNTTKRIVDVQFESQGRSGTEIYSGVIEEEYLREMKGKDAAKEFDEMRRSDAEIKMVLSAVKNPIRSAKWSIEAATDNPTDVLQAKLMEQILFNNTQKTWRRFLTEALTCVDFGHAIFEITHNVVKNSVDFGTYIGIAELGLRSAKTIEKYNVDKTGKLQSIEQVSYGDSGKSSKIEACFLYNFVLDLEGDNFEGISMLRPCYGAYIRKKKLLQLKIVGSEKYAVPTPIGTIPAGKEESPDAERFKAVLEKFTTHQQQYIVKPEGWEIDFMETNFDPDKLDTGIESENKEIVKAFLANFLELGIGSTSGSYSLSFDQSDFFLGGIEHIAESICEIFNTRIIPDMIQLNYGPQDKYPQLKVSGISDRAGAELASAIKSFVDGKVIVPDDDLEDHIRTKYGLPERSLVGQRKIEAAPAPFFSEGVKFVEGKPKTPRALMKQGEDVLLGVMQTALKGMSEEVADELTKQFMKRPDSSVPAAATTLTISGEAKYRAKLKEALMGIGVRALEQAQKELPSKKKVTLSESIRFADEDDLGAFIEKYITARASLLASSQMDDLKKAAQFKFLSASSWTDSESVLKKELNDALNKYVDSSSVMTAAANSAAFTVNEVRNEFFQDPEVLEDVESFTFTNPSPETELCQSLVGMTVTADDPAFYEYSCPLHHNCKSYWSVNSKGSNKKITGVPTLNQKERGQMSLSELKVEWPKG